MYFHGISSVLLVAAALGAVNAHTTFTNFFVDNVPQGDGTCVRMSNNIDQATFPIRPIGAVTSNDMACGTSAALSIQELLPNGSACFKPPTYCQVAR